MKPGAAELSPYYRKGLPAAIVITLLFALFAAFLASGQGGFKDARSTSLNFLVLAFSSLIIFQIFHSGHVHHWRRIFFSTYAVAFAISFVWWTMGDRGHMWLLDAETLYSQAPMCHIVVPMLLLPLVFTKEIIFPTAFAGAAFMILLVAMVGVIYGRGFCSWGCFFGGQDELFSSLARSKRWKIRVLKPWVRLFPFGLLVFIVLHSFATMSPTYCFWFCPFKTSSEFIEVSSFVRVIQTFMFVILWVLLAVFLPVISKKRIQCGLFCPMGAFLSCTSRINLFGLRIDSNRCKDCNRCIDACPTFSMTKESLNSRGPTITCNKCGACIEICPEQAIGYTTLGVPFPFRDEGATQQPAERGIGRNLVCTMRKLGRDLWDPGVVFIFGIFVLGNTLATHYLVDSVSRLLKYFIGI